MPLPDELLQAIERKAESVQFKALKAGSLAISNDYRSGRNSHRGFCDPAKMLSYLATRMPATFGACSAVFKEIRARLPHYPCQALMDLGAGPGTASWAALNVFSELSQLYLIEKEPDAIKIGQELSQNSFSIAWNQAIWEQASLELSFEIPPADLAVLSYSYGELEKNAAQSLLERLWERQIALIAVIEPGTPKGFERIREVREFALQKGAFLVAPCPHASVCPMSSGWCHFRTRIERTRLHRQLKEATLGYEDEKFSYLVYAHPKINVEPSLVAGRVVGFPYKGSGHVRLPLCTMNGTLKEELITRRDRDLYRQARDAEWGTGWVYTRST